MATAHIYVRVSTDKQDLSPEWQRNVCETYCKNELSKRGFVMNPTIFEDIGQSAYKLAWSDREAGRQLFAAIKPGDIIVVAKQDRAWRTVRDKENCMFMFRQLGIGIAILDTNLDTSTAAGKFASGIVALQAQWESDVRSERGKAAAQVRKARKTPGKMRPPPGWKYDRIAEELVPDMQERRLLAQIYRWRESGTRSIAATCRWLKEEGVRRASGWTYNAQWVTRAYSYYTAGWPMVGYGMRQQSVRLPVPQGKAHMHFKSSAVDTAAERWLSATYSALHEAASQPAES